MANVAYSVLSVGKFISNGYTGVFAPTGSFIAKNGRRVGVQTRGKTFILEGKLGGTPASLKTPGQKHQEIGQHVVAPVTRGLAPGQPSGDPDDEMISEQDLADFRARFAKAKVDEASRSTQSTSASSDGTGFPAAQERR